MEPGKVFAGIQPDRHSCRGSNCRSNCHGRCVLLQIFALLSAGITGHRCDGSDHLPVALFPVHPAPTPAYPATSPNWKYPPGSIEINAIVQYTDSWWATASNVRWNRSTYWEYGRLFPFSGTWPEHVMAPGMVNPYASKRARAKRRWSSSWYGSGWHLGGVHSRATTRHSQWLCIAAESQRNTWRSCPHQPWNGYSNYAGRKDCCNSRNWE